MRLPLWHRFSRKTKHMFIVMLGGTGGFAVYATVTGNAKFYRNWVMPAVRLIDAESSHRLAIVCAKHGLIPRMENNEPENLKCRVLGLDFTSPVGLAAGFDKDGEAVTGLFRMGFGFVEIGSVTPLPQTGNERPRVFRLTEDGAVINRYGFNSAGHDVVHENLVNTQNEQDKVLSTKAYPDDRNLLNESHLTGGDRERVVGYSQTRSGSGVLGVNLGKNKTSENPVGDYVLGVKKFGDVAHYLVVNISSPNTPGLRDMQGREQLQKLIAKCIELAVSDINDFCISDTGKKIPSLHFSGGRELGNARLQHIDIFTNINQLIDTIFKHLAH